MKIIVGLGNPGSKYQGTRHNAGFVFVDALVQAKELAPVGESVNFKKEDKFESEIAEILHKGEKIILVKPQTYMNLSGQAVSKLISYYKADISDLIVVSDDVDLPVGMSRVRVDGSSGGQKGLKNIIDTLGSDQFVRIRIGIQSSVGHIGDTTDIPSQIDTADFVLSKFEKRELPILSQIIDQTIDYILPYLGKDEMIPARSLQVVADSL